MSYDRDLDAIIAHGTELPKGVDPPWGEVGELETVREAAEGWWHKDVCGFRMSEDEEDEEAIRRAIREFELAETEPATKRESTV